MLGACELGELHAQELAEPFAGTRLCGTLDVEDRADEGPHIRA